MRLDELNWQPWDPNDVGSDNIWWDFACVGNVRVWRARPGREYPGGWGIQSWKEGEKYELGHGWEYENIDELTAQSVLYHLLESET